VYFDASALVKVFIEEDYSRVVSEAFYSEPTRCTTIFCYYETLSAFKRKWLKKEITQEQYADASFKLTAWFSHFVRRTPDLDFTDSSVFKEVTDIAQRNSLDLSDAFQILSVKRGRYSGLILESRTILATADEDLAKAACSEGIKTMLLGQSGFELLCDGSDSY
jgi:predicted nucleic acid-binding protein